jgi:hypothetical protein
MESNAWILSSLRHVTGMCAITKSDEAQFPQGLKVETEYTRELGWNYREVMQWCQASAEIEIRLKTAQMFNAADKDGNGTLSFDEYFSHRAKNGAVVQEMKAKLAKDFKDMDKDGNGELDFEEVVSFMYGFSLSSFRT